MACCFKENPSTSLCEEGPRSSHSGSSPDRVEYLFRAGAQSNVHTKGAKFAARTEKDEMVGVSILFLRTV